MHDRRMKRKAESLPLFTRLAKAILIIMATFCGSSNAAVADRAFDEAAQLNSFDSRIESKLSTRRTMKLVAREAMAQARVERGEPVDQRSTSAFLVDDSGKFLGGPAQFTMPRTSFGVGSIALRALGHSASVQYSRL